MTEAAAVAPPIDARRSPPGPLGKLGLRNAYRFTSDQLGLLRSVADEYGDLAQMEVLGRKWFIVVHPDDIEAIFIKHARIMLRDAYVVVLERFLGKGLLTSDGELWKRQRKLMSQAFTPKRIQGYAEAMVRVTGGALTLLHDGQVVNLHQEMGRITMAVVADVLFGAGVSVDDVRAVGASMEAINEFLANSPEAMFMVPSWVPTPRNRRVLRATAQLNEFIFGIIGPRRGAGAEPRDDLLGTLLAAQDDDGTKMTDAQIRDEAVTLFLAGHETTSLLLAHTIYLLSKHPAIERRLLAEIDEVLGGALPTAADVRALPYTERVLKEAMRLYPPAWTIGREVAEDFELRGYVIPKGSQMMLSPWVVHRDPRWFPNPEGFDPDRWEPERAKSIPRFAYFPFGGGPRVCIGNHFAMIEATLVLVMVLQRFRLELLPGERLELAPAVTLRQKGAGLRVRVVARDIPARPA